MKNNHVRWLFAFALLSSSFFASHVNAYSRHSVEITMGLGAFDHGTTGVGGPLLGHGYDHGTAAMGEISAKLLFRCCSYFSQGFVLRYGNSAGSSFGMFSGYAYSISMVELGYTARQELPCMRNGKKRFYISGSFGLSGAHTDASTGARVDKSDWDARLEASRALDHLALGWALDLSFDIHFGIVMISAGVGAKQHFGIHDIIARRFALTAMLRVGLAFDLKRKRRYHRYRRRYRRW